MPPTDEEAAKRFPGWLRQHRRNAKELEIDFKVNYTKLSRLVHLFVESTYAELSVHERPNVLEVEHFVRKAWAQKAAATRKRNAAKKSRQKLRAAREALKAEQASRQGSFDF